MTAGQLNTHLRDNMLWLGGSDGDTHGGNWKVAAGYLQLATNTWHLSSEGNQRLHYTVSGASYLKGGLDSGATVVFRQANDASVLTLYGGGGVSSGNSPSDPGANNFRAQNGVLGPVASISGTTTLSDAHELVLASASGGAYTVTLPTASGRSGKRYSIKKTDSSANAVTIGSGGGTIDGASTQILFGQYDAYTVESDGSNWFIV